MARSCETLVSHIPQRASVLASTHPDYPPGEVLVSPKVQGKATGFHLVFHLSLATKYPVPSSEQQFSKCPRGG